MESRRNVMNVLENIGVSFCGGEQPVLSIQTFFDFYIISNNTPESQDETLTCDEFISQYGNVSSLQSVSSYSGINASLDSENAELRNSVRVLSDDKERLVKLLEIANQNSISWQGMSYKNNFLLTTLIYVVFGLIIGAVLAWMI